LKTRVLDTFAIIEWIDGKQPARNQLDAIFAEAAVDRIKLLMSAINVGEAHYVLRKRHSVALAVDWRALSRTLPVTIEVPAMDDIWNAAALKGQFPISYADAFAAALALKYDCPLVTGDREFRKVTNLELDWLPS
jgi:ribonuclease VapC